MEMNILEDGGWRMEEGGWREGRIDLRFLVVIATFVVGHCLEWN